MLNRCDPEALLALLQGDLDPEQARGLLRHLESCSACRERLQVMAGLAALERNRSSGPRRRKYFYVGVGTLAAGVLMALALIPVWREGQQGGFSRIATSEPYPLFPLRTRAEDPTPDLGEAMRRYAELDYAGAEVLLAAFPENAEALFFRGVCLYFLERFEDAAVILEKAQADSRWEEPALWFRANALLRSGSKVQARKMFQELATSSGRYRAEAQRILSQLESRED